MLVAILHLTTEAVPIVIACSVAACILAGIAALSRDMDDPRR